MKVVPGKMAEAIKLLEEWKGYVEPCRRGPYL